MKIKFLLISTLCFFTSQYINAQVGIGTTTPHSSSALEIKSTNSGILIPRINLVSLADSNTISNPQESLLIYNLTNSSELKPGFYYWNQGWKALGATSGATLTNTWLLDGNTLNSGNEFIGTKSYHPLLFKVNGSAVSRFHPNGGLAIGLNAMANDNNSIAIGTGALATSSNQATAIGPSSNAAGYQSVALGYGSKTSNNGALALGFEAETSGYLAAAVGKGTKASSNNAMALGNGASATNQQSIALGYESLSGGQNATAIGYQAKTSQSNAIVLGSASNSNNKVGIGTEAPDERLHIVGNLKIVDGNQSDGKVLMSDSSGKATWKSLEDPKTFGEIYKTNDTVIQQNNAVAFGGQGVSQNVTLSSNTIQVQTTGIYKITYTLTLKKNSENIITPEFYLGIWGSEIQGSRTAVTIGNGETRTVSMTKLCSLSAYQGVGVYCNTSDNGTQILSNAANLIVEKIK